MICIDEENFAIQGSYSADKASNLVVVFEQCDDATSPVECADKTVINEWLEAKYLLTIENEKRFLQDNIDTEKVEELAVI